MISTWSDIYISIHYFKWAKDEQRVQKNITKNLCFFSGCYTFYDDINIRDASGNMYFIFSLLVLAKQNTFSNLPEIESIQTYLVNICQYYQLSFYLLEWSEPGKLIFDMLAQDLCWGRKGTLFSLAGNSTIIVSPSFFRKGSYKMLERQLVHISSRIMILCWQPLDDHNWHFCGWEKNKARIQGRKRMIKKVKAW